MAGVLYVVPVINAMGPVTDALHGDLLNTWEDVDRCLRQLFTPSYRSRYPDSRGRHLIFSWFFISWSGFTTNPVHRDFGYFTIYDHYTNVFGTEMRHYGDGLYWMYNHPASSGIGNEWGLDWLHNSHYLNILNRYVIDRGYFPSVVEVPTEKDDTSHWLENWFPFDFGNRNCRDLNLEAIQPGGHLTGAVIDWTRAPDDWSEYHPSLESYQLPGSMRRVIFRLLDIKTRLYELQPSEIEKAFQRCTAGKSTVIAAYDHDFRDRAETTMERFIEPLVHISKQYPEVEWAYANALHGAQHVLGYTDRDPPRLSVEIYDDPLASPVVRIRASEPLFGPMPYVATRTADTAVYTHHPVAAVGRNVWQIDRSALPECGTLGVAANDAAGNVCVQRYMLDGKHLMTI